MLNIALPKGRLGERVYSMFAKAGFECPQVMEQTRKLIFENEECGVRYFWVKPSDVSIYVERGAADIGVRGVYPPHCQGARHLQGRGGGAPLRDGRPGI